MPSPNHEEQAKRPPAAAGAPARVRPEATAPPQLTALTRLQRSAGNAAVGALIQRRRPAGRPAAVEAGLVQRDGPDTTGWTGKDVDTSGPGWNAKAREVTGTGVERIPVEGLKYGNQEDFYKGRKAVPPDPSKAGDKGKPAIVSHERDKTTESAAGRAIVLLPTALMGPRPAGEKSFHVSVMVHLHGHGFTDDQPFAGWRQKKGTHEVRDVDLDQIEAQMAAAAKADPGAAQTIVILPQGIGPSDFGSMPYGKYIDDVLDKVVTKRFLASKPEWDLVLSAHSGGDRIANALGSEPAKLTEVVLLDAINVKEEVSTIADWAEEHMRRVRAAPPDKQADELKKCPTLRTYHSDSPTYVKYYGMLAERLKASHAKNPPALKAALEARFPLPKHLQGSDHEHVVRGLDAPEHGPLADALRAHQNPEGKSDLHETPPPPAAPAPTQTPTPTPAPAQGVARRPSPAPTRKHETHFRPRDLTPKPRTIDSLPKGAIKADRLGKLGTPEETQFRKDVYTRQLELTLADPKRTFTVGLKPEQLGGGTVEGKPIHKDVAGDAQALVDAARVAQAQAKADKKAPDHALALRSGEIGIASAYRSIEDDFNAWQNAYQTALSQTERDRDALPDGPLSSTARDVVVNYLLNSKAVPGFSNHSKGRAIDFRTEQDGVSLTTSTLQHTLWQGCWLYKWLQKHAGEHHFTQLPTEEWHYDHDTVEPAPTGDTSATGSTPASGTGATPSPAPTRTLHRQPAKQEAPPPAPAPTAAQIAISWGPHANKKVVAASSLDVLRDVLRAAGLSKAEITSTARTAEDQARAMYENLAGKGKGQGVQAQYDLYGPAGDKVVDTYVELKKKGLSAKDIQEGMRKKIEELGPANVSRHCADPAKLNVFDVAPSSVGDAKAQKAFVKAAEAESRISKFIPYPKDPGDHFEIPVQ